MLYQLYELQRSLFVEPISDFAGASAKFYTNPLSPLGQLPLADQTAASLSLLHRLGKDYLRPEFGIHSIEIDERQVAVQENVEIDKPFCQLLHFKRFSDNEASLHTFREQPAVLIVAPLSGHYATLLRDTVRTMLQGHKVYVTDWKSARNVPLEEGSFHLDDYVNYMQEFIRHVQKQHGSCHTMSVCQPTVPVLAAVSLMATRGETTPLSMTMMGGPIDARKCPTQVNHLATERSLSWFESNVIFRVPHNFPGAGRRVYPGFMQHAGFVLMNPNRHMTSHYEYFQNLIKGDLCNAEMHRKFYDEYNAVLDMDANFYLETISTVFQKYKLMRGTWDVENSKGKAERVRPEDIRHTTLLTVEGQLDDISGSGQTKAALDLCSGIAARNKDHFEVKGAGHYGIFSGTRWRKKVYPVIQDFIRRSHQSAQKPAQSKAIMSQTTKAATKSKAVTKTPGKALSKTASKTVAQAQNKAVTKAQNETVAKTPGKALTKTASKTVAQAPNKAVTKAQNETVAKTPGKTLAKTAGKKAGIHASSGVTTHNQSPLEIKKTISTALAKPEATTTPSTPDNGKAPS